MVERGLLELGHHFGVVVVGRVGWRKGLEEFLLRPEPHELQAQTLQGPGFAARGLDEDVVVTDLEDVRTGGGDGRAGAGVEDVRDLVGAGLFGGLRHKESPGETFSELTAQRSAWAEACRSSRGRIFAASASSPGRREGSSFGRRTRGKAGPSQGPGLGHLRSSIATPGYGAWNSALRFTLLDGIVKPQCVIGLAQKQPQP